VGHRVLRLQLQGLAVLTEGFVVLASLEIRVADVDADGDGVAFEALELDAGVEECLEPFVAEEHEGAGSGLADGLAGVGGDDLLEGGHGVGEAAEGEVATDRLALGAGPLVEAVHEVADPGEQLGGEPPADAVERHRGTPAHLGVLVLEGSSQQFLRLFAEGDQGVEGLIAGLRRVAPELADQGGWLGGERARGQQDGGEEGEGAGHVSVCLGCGCGATRRARASGRSRGPRRWSGEGCR